MKRGCLIKGTAFFVAVHIPALALHPAFRYFNAADGKPALRHAFFMADTNSSFKWLNLLPHSAANPKTFLYLGIGAYALKLVFGSSGGGGEGSRQFVVSKVLQYPGGQYLVGIAAIIGIGMGVYQIYRGVTGKFMKRVRLTRTNMQDAFKMAGTVGYTSPGIVLGIIGYFMFHAARRADPDQAQGTSEAFDFLQNNFGSVMMAIVALGLAAYGIFSFVKARYQRINMNL